MIESIIQSISIISSIQVKNSFIAANIEIPIIQERLENPFLDGPQNYPNINEGEISNDNLSIEENENFNFE